MPTMDHVYAYLEWAATVQRKRELTIKSYGRTLELFIERHDDPSAVTSEMIEAFMNRPRRGGKPPAAATAKRERDALRAWFRWMVARGVLEADPTLDVGVPTVRNKNPHPVPDEVWVRLWRSAMPREDRVWLGLGYFAGLRRFELATIPPDVFDVENEAIVGFERKGGSTFAIEYGELVRVVADELPHLADGYERWLDDVSWLVSMSHGEPRLAPSTQGRSILIDAGWFNKRMVTLLRHAGLDGGDATPHSLRHSCATNLLRAGVPIEVIADQLSHASIETTRRYLQTSGQLGRWRAKRREQ
jgi:site-specific recombinase XerD